MSDCSISTRIVFCNAHPSVSKLCLKAYQHAKGLFDPSWPFRTHSYVAWRPSLKKTPRACFQQTLERQIVSWLPIYLVPVSASGRPSIQKSPVCLQGHSGIVRAKLMTSHPSASSSSVPAPSSLLRWHLSSSCWHFCSRCLRKAPEAPPSNFSPNAA